MITNVVRTLSAAVGIGFGAALVACGGAHQAPPTPARVADTVPRARVPMVPPDYEPPELYDSANRASDARWPMLPFMRGIVLLNFIRSATQAQRQAAVDTVRGVVVGGYAADAFGGIYLIRVPDDSTNDGLFKALRILNALPQVRWASPNEIFVGTGGM